MYKNENYCNDCLNILDILDISLMLDNEKKNVDWGNHLDVTP